MTQYDQEILKDLLRQYHEKDLELDTEARQRLGEDVESYYLLGQSSGYRNAAMMLVEAMRKLGIDQRI